MYSRDRGATIKDDPPWVINGYEKWDIEILYNSGNIRPHNELLIKKWGFHIKDHTFRNGFYHMSVKSCRLNYRERTISCTGKWHHKPVIHIYYENWCLLFVLFFFLIITRVLISESHWILPWPFSRVNYYVFRVMHIFIHRWQTFLKSTSIIFSILFWWFFFPFLNCHPH